MDNVNFQNLGVNVSASKADPTLMTIKISVPNLNQREVTDYTFSYKAKPGINEQQIATMIKTDAVFQIE